MECRFCDLETKGKQKVLNISKHCVVIFSNPRLMKGHLLIIPKRHVLNLKDLSEEEQKELFDLTIYYQDKILKNFASGCDIKQHNRPFIMENDLKVDHLHIHLQPREFEDELYLSSQIFDREIFKPLSDDEILDVSKFLK